MIFFIDIFILFEFCLALSLVALHRHRILCAFKCFPSTVLLLVHPCRFSLTTEKRQKIVKRRKKTKY